MPRPHRLLCVVCYCFEFELVSLLGLVQITGTWREGGRGIEGGGRREGGREGGRETERGREGGREGGTEGGREGERDRVIGRGRERPKRE